MASVRPRTIIPRARRRFSIPFLVATGAVASMLLAACGSSGGTSASGNSSGGSNGSSGSSAGTSGGSSGSAGTIGFLSFWTGGDPFATALAQATLAEGKKLGVTIDYVDGNNNLSNQIGAIQDFITKRVKAIVVFPGNATALIPIVNKATAAGIPVIDLNEQLSSGVKLYTYVGDNDYTYGQLEAETLVKALNGKGTFALAEGTIGYAATNNRTAGIESVLKKYPNIHMVAEQSDNFKNSQALALTQDWATKYPSLNAIVVEGPEGYIGGQWAVKHGHSNIKFIVGDYPTYVASAIKAGEVYAAVDQSPVLEAQDAVMAAYDVATGQGNKVPKPAWYVSLPVITQANVNTIKPAW
jgi:ABC-type sugar transport system substrate-binding protein